MPKAPAGLATCVVRGLIGRAAAKIRSPWWRRRRGAGYTI